MDDANRRSAVADAGQSRPTTDKRRYGTQRWRRTRLRVLNRDGWRCYVASCMLRGSVCDHIAPVYDGMPDWEFYDESNLRASCQRHNTARGVAARLEREVAGEPALPRSPLVTPMRKAPRLY